MCTNDLGKIWGCYSCGTVAGAVYEGLGSNNLYCSKCKTPTVLTMYGALDLIYRLSRDQGIALNEENDPDDIEEIMSTIGQNDDCH